MPDFVFTLGSTTTRVSCSEIGKNVMDDNWRTSVLRADEYSDFYLEWGRVHDSDEPWSRTSWHGLSLFLGRHSVKQTFTPREAELVWTVFTEHVCKRLSEDMTAFHGQFMPLFAASAACNQELEWSTLYAEL